MSNEYSHAMKAINEQIHKNEERLSGIERLKRALIERGATKQVTQGNTLLLILSTMASEKGMLDCAGEDLLVVMREAVEKSRKAQMEYEIQRSNFSYRYISKEREIEEKEREIKEEKEKIELYIKEIETMETEEARDALKKAAIYEMKCKGMITNGYERKAYIENYGKILAGKNTRENDDEK